MTTKIILRGRVKKEGSQGVRKEGKEGTHLEILLSAESTGKNSILESRIFIFVAFSQEIQRQ